MKWNKFNCTFDYVNRVTERQDDRATMDARDDMGYDLTTYKMHVPTHTHTHTHADTHTHSPLFVRDIMHTY